jgi:segregation and condensation protein B
MDRDKEKKIFYASLFLSGAPLEKRFFRSILEPVNLENRLLEYAEEFNKLSIGLKIRMVSGGFQLVTESSMIEELRPHFGERTETLGRASMETAAIVAYKQPVTRLEIDEIRGVNSAGTVKYLLDRNLIKVVGRKEVPGRPLLYSTTKQFLEYFGMNDLSEMPTFREWQELKQSGNDKAQ